MQRVGALPYFGGPFSVGPIQQVFQPGSLEDMQRDHMPDLYLRRG